MSDPRPNLWALATLCNVQKDLKVIQQDKKRLYTIRALMNSETGRFSIFTPPPATKIKTIKRMVTLTILYFHLKCKQINTPVRVLSFRLPRSKQ